jgi:hypothetical protein
MKIQLLLADLVALVEVVDEHIDRTFPGVGAPPPLRKLRTKLIHMVRTYPKAGERSSSRSRPESDKPDRVRSSGKSSKGKTIRKRPQTQASR